MAAHLIKNNFQFIDSNGNPVSGGTVEFYEPNGSSTPKAVYSGKALTPSAGTSATLNALGMFTAELFGDGDYYIVVKYADGSTAYDMEYIEGEGSGSAATEWVDSGVTPTYVSATSFSVPGDLTETFHIGRRIKTENTGGTVYSTIISSVFSSNTTVTIINDSGSLDAGLSSVDLSFTRSDNKSMPSYYHKAHSGAAASSIELTGLTFKKNTPIRVSAYIVGSVPGSTIELMINSDTTAANYHSGYSTDGASTVIANTATTGISLTGSQFGIIDMTIYPDSTDDSCMIIGKASEYVGTGDMEVTTFGIKYDTSSTVTAIGFNAAAVMIAAGSTLNIKQD